jgi:hypothetical protein
MPATVVQVLDGLATRLRTIDGLRVYDRPADITAAPAAFMLLEAVDYQNAFALGDPRMEITVSVVVARTSDRAAYERMSEYLAPTGSRSVRAAIEADRSLGGVCQTLIVLRADNVRMVSQGDADYLAVDFGLTVHA